MNILERILQVKQREVKHLRKRFSPASFRESPFYYNSTLGFRDALKQNDTIAVIAEIKQASPSRGLIRPGFNHLEIAAMYRKAGADAISILTDRDFFKGDLRFLEEIATDKTEPLLRKDFIIDEYQIFEARASGADAVLLIAEILDAAQIRDLTSVCSELDMDVLLELHTPSQLDKIDFGLNRLIGINNRNLENFSVSLQTTVTISRAVPDTVTLVSESGIHKQDDLDVLKSLQIDAILVGEHLMKAEAPSQTLTELKGWCRRAG